MSDLRLGDCLEVLCDLDDASVDAVVTDPPYGISFMGKTWDSFGGPSGRDNTTWSRLGGSMHAGSYDLSPYSQRVFQAWCSQWGAECLRVLKPGGHLVSFGGTRTYHRLAAGLEDAGFEIRDCLAWLFGSGFPKSLDVSKAIDRKEGHWRGRAGEVESTNGAMSGPNYSRTDKGDPVTPAAAAAGLGTALKPAFEPIVLARKPLSGTVAENWMAHGTGALHIDGARIRFASADDQAAAAAAAAAAQRLTSDQNENRTVYGRFENGPASLDPYLAKMDQGRWPANVLLDDEAAALLDQQTGVLTSGRESDRGHRRNADRDALRNAYGGFQGQEVTGVLYGDSGGASRFFYCAKTSRAERHAGCEDLGAAVCPDGRATPVDNPRLRGATPRANNHPTVKPVDLMRWLTRLVTPAGGLIVDPFLGSGTTGIASVLNGYRFIGIEREPDYLAIAQARIEFWTKHGEDGLRICRERDAAERIDTARILAGQLSLLAE